MMHRKIYYISILVVVTMLIFSSLIKNTEQHDAEYSKQWALNNEGKISEMEIEKSVCRTDQIVKGIDINFEKMCRYLDNRKPKREIIVAVIDTGIDFSSIDLEGLQWRNPHEIENNEIDDDANGKIDDTNGWNFIDSNNVLLNEKQPQEDSHGTVCAGIIAAKQNGYGIEGITRGQKIKLMSLKVLGINYKQGDGRIINVIEAIRYAEEMGASICNLSLGTEVDSPELYAVMKKSNMLFVTSAGNNAGLLRVNIDKKKQYPASYQLPNLITVANLSFDGELYQESNYGPISVDLAAPGTNILSTTIDGKYIYSTGTSLAAPYVSGVAAVLYQYMDNPSPSAVKRAICESVVPLPSLNEMVKTGGMLDTHKAVLLGIQTKFH
jgi:subtilisin family serine protease